MKKPKTLRTGPNGLPVCTCGEEVAVPHKECKALWDVEDDGPDTRLLGIDDA